MVRGQSRRFCQNKRYLNHTSRSTSFIHFWRKLNVLCINCQSWWREQSQRKICLHRWNTQISWRISITRRRMRYWLTKSKSSLIWWHYQYERQVASLYWFGQSVTKINNPEKYRWGGWSCLILWIRQQNPSKSRVELK